jgi:hypothetical protein
VSIVRTDPFTIPGASGGQQGPTSVDLTVVVTPGAIAAGSLVVTLVSYTSLQ